MENQKYFVENAYRRQRAFYAGLKRLSQISSVIVVIVLVCIILFMLKSGLPHLTPRLIFGEYRNTPSIRPALLGTLILVLVSIVTAAPIGIATAIFLAEYTSKESKIVRIIRIAIETLAGIPSIVYGLFGYLFFVVWLRLGYSLIGGGLTLAIMVLPVIVMSTEESLLSVPMAYREGSYALGASKSRTIFKIILPCASRGIVTSIILACGRIISESAVLILTIGMVVNKDPSGIFSPGTSLALDVYYFGSNGYPDEGAATGALLLFVIIIMNLISLAIGKYLNKGVSDN